MSGDNAWSKHLDRALTSKLSDLLGPQPDDGALGAGILAWLARSLAVGNMHIGAVTVMLSTLSGQQPCEFSVGELVFDGVGQDSWRLMLQQAGSTDAALSLEEAVQLEPSSRRTSAWMRDWSRSGGPEPHALLADYPDLWRLDCPALGAALRPSMSLVAERKGDVPALLFATNLSYFLLCGIEKQGESMTCTATLSTGTWSLRCSRAAFLGLTADQVARRADTSTPEGARVVGQMLDRNEYSAMVVSYGADGHTPTNVEVRGPR